MATLAFHPLTVAAVTPLCEDAVAVTFAVPDELADAYAFAPGQSLTLRRRIEGREERRSYSICSPVGSPLRIGVREVSGGVFSTWLVHEVRPGDEVDVGTPTGAFTPDLHEAAHHALIVAGSGITPALSIASSVLRHPGSRVTALYGNRRTSTVMFADELADLKDRYCSRLSVAHVFSREPREVDLCSGRLDAGRIDALLAMLGDLADVDHWWLCGPFGMVTDAQEVLRKAGVPNDRVHRELFFVGDLPPPPGTHPEPDIEGDASTVNVILDGRSTTAAVARTEAVLDGAQRVRPDLPFACKGGVCGTCRAKVTSGRVHMSRNFALDPFEVDAGFVLTCQSRPVSGEITVDFDA